MPRCFRCQELLSEIPSTERDILMYRCLGCSSNYTQKQDEALHDSWGMPISLPLYATIFDRDPLSRAHEVAESFKDRSDLDLQLLKDHIDAELATPKQRVSEILDFVYATEDQLRDFLREFRHHLAQ